MSELTAADFQPHVGTTFTIDGDTHAMLDEVREFDGPEGFRSPFALYFRGPREPVLPQQTHSLEHAELGTLEIFLVPVGSTEAGTLYEAIFN